LWQYAVLTARAPNAQYAPLSFLSAGLFSADIHNVYEQLQLPVLVIHGTKGDFTDYRGTVIIKDKKNWSIKVIEGGALVYFEQPKIFFNAVTSWLSRDESTDEMGLR